MIAVRKYLRLLPAVVIVGTGLLVLKGVDIARAAQAVEASPDEPDNTGLAPADTGGAPANKDYADGDGTIASAAEVDVLSSLTQRRTELDARERALAMRENLLTAGEARVDQKIAALKNLQSQMQTLLADRDDKQKAQIASLVKSYGPDGMAPKKAATIFNTMPDEVLLPIAKAMKPADLGPILAAMNPDAAQRLTVKLATLLKLPDTAVACPTPTTAADLTAPTSAAPLQTAALSPPGVTPVVTPVTPPSPAPAAMQPPPAAAPPAQAAAPPPPKPTAPKPRVAKVTAPATVKPTAPATTPPPAKPTTAAVTPPTTATVTPPGKPAVVAPPGKPQTAAAATPAPVTTSPATTPPASTAPAKPQAASGPPASITPAPGG